MSETINATKPILFSAPMVRALLNGTKTQTRRVLKLPTKGIYEHPQMGGWAASTIGGGGAFSIARDGSRRPVPEEVCIWHQTTGTCLTMKWKIGDRLWVRETFCYGDADGDPLHYRATDSVQSIVDGDGFAILNKDGSEKSPWVSSIHMPRWASRLTLTVTDVRVERLQDITSADAISEGIAPHANSMTIDCATPNPRDDFKSLWGYINSPISWDANPWVVALTFTAEKRNIDAKAAV